MSTTRWLPFTIAEPSTPALAGELDAQRFLHDIDDLIDMSPIAASSEHQERLHAFSLTRTSS